jgi:hypothetical protein
MSRAVFAVALVAALALADASGWAQNFGAARFTDSYVRVDWQLGQNRKGQPVVWGRVHNVRGITVTRVRLAVDELSASGAVASTTTGYVDSPIGAHGNVYFDVRVPRADAQYRVTVLHFELLPDAGSGR